MQRILIAVSAILLAAFVAVSIGASSARATCLAPVTGGASPSTVPGCIPPNIYRFDSNGVLNVSSGSSVTIYYDFDEATNGCTIGGGSWSTRIDTSANPHGRYTGSVRSPGLTGTTAFGMNCDASPAGQTQATPFTVNVAGGGGGGGGSCTENDPSQLSSQFVSYSGVPTSIAAGKPFTANVTFKNTGQCAWTAGIGIKAGSTYPDNNMNWGVNRVLLSSTEVINPGVQKTFVVNATAPSVTSTQLVNFGFRMVRDGVNWFGASSPLVQIQVIASAPPSTSLPAVTSFTISKQMMWTDDLAATMQWSCANSTSASITSDLSSGGSWSGLPVSSSKTVKPPHGGYTYTLTCYNGSTASPKADRGLAVFNANERNSGNSPSGANVDPNNWDSALGCRWKSETNQDTVPITLPGLNGGRLKVRVSACVSNGFIRKMRREVLNLDGPNYPLSGWKLDGVVSNGPCDENCSNYVTLFGVHQTVRNIWMKARWSLCLGVRILGSVCIQSKTLTVGVRFRGDGTREDTYNDSTP